jgi:hypothetical protein
MAWLLERPALPAKRVSDVFTEIVALINSAARPAELAPRELWARAGEAARTLTPYGRVGTDFARRHGATLGAIGGALTVGVIAYYVFRAIDRTPRRKLQHNPALVRHFPPR